MRIIVLGKILIVTMLCVSLVRYEMYVVPLPRCYILTDLLGNTLHIPRYFIRFLLGSDFYMEGIINVTGTVLIERNVYDTVPTNGTFIILREVTGVTL